MAAQQTSTTAAAKAGGKHRGRGPPRPPAGRMWPAGAGRRQRSAGLGRGRSWKAGRQPAGSGRGRGGAAPTRAVERPAQHAGAGQGLDDGGRWPSAAGAGVTGRGSMVSRSGSAIKVALVIAVRVGRAPSFFEWAAAAGASASHWAAPTAHRSVLRGARTWPTKMPAHATPCTMQLLRYSQITVSRPF